ncbi:MAG: phosphoethanolamine transferase [Synergistaceae bacterium]|nr:phosphoethanolamine transferase [Synergistaceae bacterium]
MGERDRSVGELLGALGRAAFWSFALVACFSAFFYAAQGLSIPGYELEPGFWAANVAFLGGATLAIMTLPGPAWLWALLCYLAMLLPTEIVSGYIVLYRVPFGFNVLYFVWQTFGSQASEFAEASLGRVPWLPLWGLGCAVLPALCLRPLVRATRALKATGAILRVGALLVGLLFVFWGGYIGDAREYNWTTKTYDNFLRFCREIRFVRARAAQAPAILASVDVRPALGPGERETVVLVVGESASRHHWGLYGYPRDTTPFMSARAASGDIWALRDVNATTAASVLSQFRALTFIDQMTYIEDYRFAIVDVFARAGFKTFWLDNNITINTYNLVQESFTRNCDVWRVMTAADVAARRSYDPQIVWGMADDSQVLAVEDQPWDEHLLPWLDEALADPAPKKLIVVHLKGSHVVYAYRYPPEFDVFHGREGIRSPWLDEEPMIEDVVNTYDCSILYTDWLLEQVIRRMEAVEGRSLMFHFSDHGEEGFDFYPFYGRMVEHVSKFVTDVPLIVWASPTWRDQRDASAFASYLDRPMRLDDVPHALMDLAGVRGPMLDETRSPFSERWILRPRFVNDTPYLRYPPEDMLPAMAAEEAELVRRFLDEEPGAVGP